MDIVGPAKMLKIHIGEVDTWHGKPVSTALVERLREEGLAGATVMRAVEGYGANSRIHTARILRLSEDLPLVIDVIDKPERIERAVPLIEEMVGDGLITVLDVEVVHDRHSSGKDRGRAPG